MSLPLKSSNDGLSNDDSDSSDTSSSNDSETNNDLRSNDMKDTDDDRDDNESTLHLVHLSEDIRKNRAAIRFQTFNTLKSLCVAKIICHQEFFVNNAEITKTNPMDKLPTNLRKLMLKSAWKISPEITTGLKQESNFKKHRARRERKLFVNLLIYQGVLELVGPNLGSWRTETDFWKTMVKEGAASLLRVSFDQTPKLLGRYLCYLLALEKLRIIQIPNLLCSNEQLESIAVRLPSLQELSTVRVSFVDGADYTSSLDALSKLKALEKFIFSYQDKHDMGHLKFMDQCIQKLPSLRYVGSEMKDMYSYRFVDILVHNLQVYENEKIVKFGFERIVLNKNVPRNCELPNLQSIYVVSPVHDVSGIAKFANVTELGFVGKCETSLEILSIMGNQLTSLHMCVPSVNFSSIFNCCKKLKSLNITVDYVENSEEMWSSDSLLNLETFVFIMSDNPASCPDMFLYQIMQAPMLKVLEIFNACTRRDETKLAIADVRNGLILQNLVRFRFFRSFVDLDQSMDDDYCRSLVRILLKCCAAYCPKLTEARLDGAIITRAFLDAEQRRMELLVRSH